MASSILKGNAGESIQRYAAFWRNERIDRPPVVFDIVGPHGHPTYDAGPEMGVAYHPEKYENDLEGFCRDYERMWEARVNCRDDSIPCVEPMTADVFGSGWTVGGRQVNRRAPRGALAQVRLDEIAADAESEQLESALQQVSYVAQQSRGRFGVNVDGMTTTAMISKWRGGTQFMYDIVDDPKGVRALAERITQHCLQVQAKVDGLLPRPEGGTCHGWLYYWNPGRGFWFQEDDAIMVSPRTYRDLFLDLDRAICNSTDHAAVHWHSGMLHLLDELLTIENLRLVQISIDPNGPPIESMLETCQRIEAAGKKAGIQCQPEKDFVKLVFSKLRPGSCLFFFNRIGSIAEANDFVAWLERTAPTFERSRRRPKRPHATSSRR